MNLGQRIAFMQAAANPFPLAASFHQVEGGGYKCKMCGAAVKDQGACADHLLMKHREMESSGTSEGVKKAWDTRGRGGWREKHHDWLTKNGFKIDEKNSETKSAMHTTAYTHPDAGKVKEALNHFAEQGFKADEPRGYRLSDGSHHRNLDSADGKGLAQVGTGPRGKGASVDLSEAHTYKDSMEAREFSEKRRKKLAKSGDAMPGGGFPIVNKEDLGNAKQAIGRAKNPAAARRHINERAKELGAKPIGAQVEFSPEMRLRMPKKAGQDTTTQNPQYTGGQPELRAGGPGSGRHKEGGTRGKSMEELANMHKPHEGMCNLSNKVCRAYVDMKIEHPGFDPSGTRPPYKPKMEAFTTRQRGLAHTGGFHKGSGMGKGCSSHGFHRGSGYEHKAANMGHRLPLSASEDKPEIRQRPARPSGRPRRASYNFRGEQQLI